MRDYASTIVAGLLFIAGAGVLASTIIALVAAGQAWNITLFRFGFIAVLLFGTGLLLLLIPLLSRKAGVE